MRWTRGIAAAGVLAVVLALVAAAARAADWPQFRGPTRDGVSAETGLAPAWPEGGPPLVRTVDGVGEGFSSPVVAAERLFETGRLKDELYVFAFDVATARPLWRAACGTAYTAFWPGSRSTPTVAGGRLYVLSGEGRLTALEADSGSKVWTLNLFETFGGKRPMYGAAESVLVVGDTVICTPGGPDACLAALDAGTGRTVWTSRGLSDRAAFASTIAIDYGGVRQVVALTEKGLVGVALADGKPLWRFTDYFGGFMAENVLAPVFRDGIVFGEGGHYGGGGAVRLKADAGAFSVEPLWKKSGGSTHLGGYVERGGFLYGDTGRGWSCVDLAGGDVRHKTSRIRGAATLWADGRFYCLGEKGTMHLVEADPNCSRIVGEFSIPNAGSQTWAYPAISDGRLYVRRLEQVHVYDISRPR